MKKKTHIGVLDFNSPVILGLTGLSLVVLLLDIPLGGRASLFLSAHYTSFADPLLYMRLFTHVLAHAGWEHYLGNFLLILVVGPMVEEKYGSRNLLLMVAITALATGLVNVIFFRNVAVMGASGLAFMMILLSSFTNLREGKLPVTLVLVAVFYLGSEVLTGATAQDNISQLSHIVGGLCGAAFGFFFNKDKLLKNGPAGR